MMAERPLVWWHLSDIHWEVRSSTERRVFLDALVSDLTRRRDALGSPDFVVISGDLTQSGEESEYLDLTGREFIE